MAPRVKVIAFAALGLAACGQLTTPPAPAPEATAVSPTPAAYDLSGVAENLRAAVESARAAREQCHSVINDLNAHHAQFDDSIGYTAHVDSHGVWTGCTAFVFKNGDRHIGIWGDNGTQSYGVYESADGTRYEGAFMNIAANGYDMQREGPGVLWDAAGRVQEQGVWSAGRLATRSNQ